jgi:hypothetical protein
MKDADTGMKENWCQSVEDKEVVNPCRTREDREGVSLMQTGHFPSMQGAWAADSAVLY